MSQCLLLSLLASEQVSHINYDILYVNEIWLPFESMTMGVVCVPSRCYINYILTQSSSYKILCRGGSVIIGWIMFRGKNE